MRASETELDRLWNRCASLANDLEEGLWSMFPRDWEDIAGKLDELLGEMEELSPSRRQTFAESLGR
ncbi:MAG: hypothetical protein E7K72_00365 [Roseomonas mucosa]|nr:hypothetical protein [Roseomonas mucosa]